MMAVTKRVAQKLWNKCNVLHDDGKSYDDYVEQFTYLLFLKLADNLFDLYHHTLEA